ncbi:ABC transporter permease [Nocardioides sp. NBC_00850]|uniref:ABC transporter permease n=1 Tax=Nocardioides sp. NBC_00850 TaxID=2976001 RepID=UPI003863C2A8|nr:ABC transporter permease [Nocardioides sp. NBC_00850]
MTTQSDSAVLATPVPRRPRSQRPSHRSMSGPGAIGAVTAVLFVLACIFVSGFASANNLRALMLSVSLVGIVAVGLSLITMAGRIFSLSLSAVVATAAIIFAANLHLGPWIAMALAVAFGAATGLAQGVLVGLAHTNPIVTTIAASAIILGVAQLVTGGLNITGEGDASVFATMLFGTLPLEVLVFFAVTAAAALLYRYTNLGRTITLIGLNEKAAAVAGLRSWPRVVAAFIISGTLAALAGALLAAESGQGNLTLGASYGFDAIVAVVVGGISVKGGLGNPVNAAVGAFLVGLLANMLVLMGLSYEDQLIFQGVLVLVAVVVTGASAKPAAAGRR